MPLFCAMKKLYCRIQEWRYHRKFCKLYMLFIDKTGETDTALRHAVTAFEWLYEFDYRDLYRHFRKWVGLNA